MKKDNPYCFTPPSQWKDPLHFTGQSDSTLSTILAFKMRKWFSNLCESLYTCVLNAIKFFSILHSYILNNFVFMNLFWFFVYMYMEKLETLFFCRLSRRPDHYPAHFICTSSLCLVSLDKIPSYLRCCNTNLETAILNLKLDNKNIHHAPLVSAQLAVDLTIMGRATARIKISTRHR